MNTIQTERMTESYALYILANVRHEIGRNYKSKIRRSWETCDYVNLEAWAFDLQRIRNCFGPSWLVKAKPL